MAYRVTIGDTRWRILHGQVRSSYVLIGWAGLAKRQCFIQALFGGENSPPRVENSPPRKIPIGY